MSVILDLLKQRASIRDFTDSRVPEKVIGEILEAGRLSPSGGNEQPWQFGVITEKDLISSIAKLARQPWIVSAPLIIVLCVAPVSDYDGGRMIQIERFPKLMPAIQEMDSHLYQAINMEEHQTKIAGSYMLLVALEHGLGGCWVSRFDVFRLAELLALPKGVLASEMLVLGYPAAGKDPRSKKPLSEIAFFDRWQKK